MKAVLFLGLILLVSGCTDPKDIDPIGSSVSFPDSETLKLSKTIEKEGNYDINFDCSPEPSQADTYSAFKCDLAVNKKIVGRCWVYTANIIIEDNFCNGRYFIDLQKGDVVTLSVIFDRKWSGYRIPRSWEPIDIPVNKPVDLAEFSRFTLYQSTNQWEIVYLEGLSQRNKSDEVIK